MSSNKVNTELPVPRLPDDGLALVACPDTGGPNYLYNGTTFDLERNDVEIVVLASSAGTTTTRTSADIISHNAESLLLMLRMETVGTGSITPSLQGKDPISGLYFTYWTAELPITSAGPGNAVYSYFFANGASGGEFTECQAFGLGPRVFRVVCTANNANGTTYSCSAVLGDN